MPRLPHGAVIPLEALRVNREAMRSASENIPLAFGAVQPMELTEFAYLFPGLQSNPANLLPQSAETHAALIELGQAMRDTSPESEGNSGIPAMYTYLGQFIDHDITLETTSDRLRDMFNPDVQPIDPAEVGDVIMNARTATLDLDSVYGLPAPRDEHDIKKLKVGVVTALGGATPPNLRPEGKDDFNDLPREPRNTDPLRDRAALIGDPRNDENTIISQLHLAFLRAHNALIDQGMTFRQARRTLRRHYQHVVVHDFLPRIADPAIVDDILANGNKIYRPGADSLTMPLEFSVAAYRFGHSMVRANYNFNVNFNSEGFPASLGLLFTFSALSGQLGFGDPSAEPHLSGTDTLPDNWIIEWERFAGAGNGNMARKIDTKLVEPLFELPSTLGAPELGNRGRLAVRNLLRGYMLRMPTGQAVARAMNRRLGAARAVPVLSPAQLEAGAGSDAQADVLRRAGFLARTPLWYYILAEAAALADGEHLGPVGSRIVAEVLIGLVRNSQDSILRLRRWRPTMTATAALERGGSFELADLLALAGVADPAVAVG